MGQVVLDGENVDFQGPPPASVSETWSLLENFLNQSGLLIESLRVDGREWLPEQSEDLENYRLIEVFSMTQEQNIANMVQELLGQREAVLTGWSDQARRVLSSPWGECQGGAIEVLNATQPLVQCAGLLVEYSKQSDASWGAVLERAAESLNETLSSLMDAFEEADCIVFSDLSEGVVLPGLTEVYRVLSEDMVLSMERGVQN